ncbi:hypothetical protein, partial [Paraburkholderia sp.]|uniref:hypothetical protein n=1 Tax=Paraburkholderia sp. TaxID=1926495 RepID=UPI002629FEBF
MRVFAGGMIVGAVIVIVRFALVVVMTRVVIAYVAVARVIVTTFVTPCVIMSILRRPYGASRRFAGGRIVCI